MKCYASHHLSFAETAVLGVCLRLTCGGSKPLHFDGRAIAERFAGESHHKVYRVAKSLAAKGWLVKKSGGFRAHAKNGLYAHTIYDVLDHDQWTLKHKHECRTVSTSANGEANPPLAPVLHRPLAPVRHSSVKELPSYPLKPESSHKVLQVRQETVVDVLPTVSTSANGYTTIDDTERSHIFKQFCNEGKI